MVRTASLFSQLLGMFPRTEFAGLARKHGSDRGAKGFDSWTQFVAMLFCQLSRADSLREICNGLACCIGKLSHLGVSGPPNKSTLSYANAHRPHEMFEELFFTTMDRFRAMEPIHVESFPLAESQLPAFFQIDSSTSCVRSSASSR